MLHRTAKLTPFGRRLLVHRILVEGWAPATAAEILGSRGAGSASGHTGWVRSWAIRARPCTASSDGMARAAWRTLIDSPERRSGTFAIALASSSTSMSRSWAVSRLGAVTACSGRRPGTTSALVTTSCTSRSITPAGSPCRGAAGRAGGDHLGLRRGRHRLLRWARRPDRATDDRQRHDLHPLAALRGPPRGPWHQARSDPTATAPDQRQGRTVHRDPPTGVGLPAALHLKPGATRFTAALARLLQSPPSPSRSRWPGANGSACQQGRRERQLASASRAFSRGTRWRDRPGSRRTSCRWPGRNGTSRRI